MLGGSIIEYRCKVCLIAAKRNSTMKFETLLFDVKENVATITLNRPDDANALNDQMADDLFAASILCTTRDDIRAVILTGTGKLFCGGGDLNEFEAHKDEGEAHLLKVATKLHSAVVRFTYMDAPLVIAVNGTAGGGGFSLLLGGDYILAHDKVKFVSAYTASSLSPDGSSTYFLAKHIGLLRAKELMLTNRVLTAKEACDWGLINKVVSPEELMSEAQSMASNFAQGPTKAFGVTKRLLQSTFSASIEEQLEKESQGISGMMNTVDGPNAIQAFLKKEKPTFTGK